MLALSDVIGHKKIKKSLQSALINGMLSHAYLFGGAPGVGKKTTGLAFARALICQQVENDACGVCNDCIRLERNVHPDMHVIRPEGAFIKIHQLRAVKGNTALTSFGGGWQVYVIEQPEKMTLAAANSFLKTLEEPLGGVLFILVSDDPAGMLPTMLSRCQRYRFNTLSEEEVLRVVAPEPQSVTERVRLAVKLAQGCPGQAITLMNDGMDKRNEMFDLIVKIIRGRPKSALVPLDDLAERDNLENFINHLTLFFRDILVWQKTGTGELVINVDRQENFAELSGAYVQADVLDILLTLERASRQLASNVNHRLLLDTLLYKIVGMRDDEREE